MLSVVVFGAGEAGRQTIASMGSSARVVAVCDNDSAKHGGSLCGHPIIAPDSIAKLAPDQVIVASMYWREIVTQLVGFGIKADQIVVAPVSSGGANRQSNQEPASTFEPLIPEWMSVNLRCAYGFSGSYEPLVSAILPTRDRAQTLPRAIESVLAQCYRNWELLVVDDGSLDDTASIVEQYRIRDPRIRFLVQDRLGVSAARNRGLVEASGELIAYVDSDNRWHPDYLALMVCAFRDDAFDTGYAGINLFDLETGRFRCVVNPYSYERLLKSNWIDLNVFMHRRELVEEMGGFDESMTRLVDWDLILRYTRHHPPFVVGSALADYFRESGVSCVTNSEPYLENRVRLESKDKVGIKRFRRPGRPRIAYVQHEFPALSQTFVQNEISRLLAKEVDVSVFHFRDSAVRASIPDAWDVAKFSNREELAYLIASRRIDLVHTHFAVPHPADFVVPVCERMCLPFTIKPHAFDIFRRDHDPRHNIVKTAGSDLCSAVYCEGTYHRAFLEGQGVPCLKLEIVRNVFEIDQFWVANPTARSSVVRLISISRFVEKKGLHLLVTAFRELPNPELRLELHGYGEERDRLVALAAGDSRISIHEGPRCPAETAEVMRDADLFLLPCVEDRNGDTDGLPTVIMEAIASGVPVLTTPIASTGDLVQDRKTGVLVASGSVADLVDGIQRFVVLSTQVRQQLIDDARLHLRAEFDPDLNTIRLLQSWGRILPGVFRNVSI